MHVVQVLPDEHADLAAELCQMQQQAQHAQQAPAATVVRLVGAVLRYLYQRRALAESGAGPGSEAAPSFVTAYPPSATVRLAAVARWPMKWLPPHSLGTDNRFACAPVPEV